LWSFFSGANLTNQSGAEIFRQPDRIPAFDLRATGYLQGMDSFGLVWARTGESTPAIASKIAQHLHLFDYNGLAKPAICSCFARWVGMFRLCFQGRPPERRPTSPITSPARGAAPSHEQAGHQQKKCYCSFSEFHGLQFRFPSQQISDFKSSAIQQHCNSNTDSPIPQLK
jgi:hypothetical protein